MISKNHSKSILLNVKFLHMFNKNKILFNERIENSLNSKINQNERLKEYSMKNKAFYSNFNNENFKNGKFSFDNLNRKHFSTKSTYESNKDDSKNQMNKQNPNSNNNINEFYLDEYFKPALRDILITINKELQSSDVEKYLTNNDSFERLYILFMEILKKGEDNLFPYLTLIFEISKNKSSQNFANKISFILTENYLNLKRKYLCLAIMNQIISKQKLLEKVNSEINADFETSFKNKIFGGGLFESILSQNENTYTKNFKGCLVITKNYKDSIEYYDIFRRFDKDRRLKIKKFGSVNLGIKGITLKKEKNLINDFIRTEQEDKKNQTVPESKLAYIKEEIAKIKEYNILIIPQEYVNLLTKNDAYLTYSDSEEEYYNKIIDFFEKISPQVIIMDDFDMYSSNNLLHLKKFLYSLDLKNFYMKNKQNQSGKNHVFLSSTLKMKNYFLHIEKEKNFDQAEINITSSLKNSVSNTNNSAIIEKINKNFINKNIVDILDEMYLNNTISASMLKDKITPNNNENNIGISDLNLKFYISKNFLKEKIFIKKFYIEHEKLKDIRQDDKINKLMRNLKNNYIIDGKKLSNENYAIVAKESDFDILEKNLKIINANYTKVDKDFLVIDNINIIEKNKQSNDKGLKNKGMIFLMDEEMIKYIDFQFDKVFLYETPDELSSYFKIFSQLREKGQLFILTLSNEYKSKIEFFEELVKISL